MGLREVKEEIGRLRAQFDPKAPDEGHVRVRIGQLEDLVRDVENQDRLRAVATADVAGVTRMSKALQAADKNLGACARASFRTAMEPLTEALGQRVRDIENPGPSGATIGPSAADRAAARATYRGLLQTNPVAASAFAARAGDSLLWDPPDPEAA